MNTKSRNKLTESEIDRIVVGQAGNDSAWTSPIRVQRKKATFLSIPADLASRAAFLARLHRTASVEEWIRHIIQERVELEEAAFVGAKQDMAENK